MRNYDLDKQAFVDILLIFDDYFSDIDECLLNPCDDNADCTNIDGNFICKCRDGFCGDGHTCNGNYNILLHRSQFRWEVNMLSQYLLMRFLLYL